MLIESVWSVFGVHHHVCKMLAVRVLSWEGKWVVVLASMRDKLT